MSDSWVSKDWTHCPVRMSHTHAFLSQPLERRENETRSLHKHVNKRHCAEERQNLLEATATKCNTNVYNVIYKNRSDRLYSHPRHEGVSGLRRGEVQAQHISRVSVKALEHLTAFNIPQRTRAITTGGQNL